MTPIGSDTVLLTFLLFCRIGGSLVYMPGIGSPRVPVQARLFIAISVTLALAPLLLPQLTASIAELSPQLVLYLMLSEVTIGILIGLMGRMFFFALEFMGTAIASLVSFSNVPGIPIESAEPNQTLAAFITFTATILFFLTDLHWEVLRGLIASYRVLPVTAGYDAQFGLIQFTDAITQAFYLALQISGPFIIYSIAINLLFGIINKLTPQIAVYFISLPFVIFGGLFVLYFTIGEFLRVFIEGYGRWLTTG